MAVQQFLLLDVAETVLAVEHVLLAAAATVSTTGVSLAISAAGAKPAFTGGASRSLAWAEGGAGPQVLMTSVEDMYKISGGQ
ncbi:hypothetical protein NHF46_18465 [Arthrobacter alpinus]|nr:hypothetical protein [Arthrobacter alpinus]